MVDVSAEKNINKERKDRDLHIRLTRSQMDFIEMVSYENDKTKTDMILKALDQNVKVILLTPTWDNSYYVQSESWRELVRHAEQVRSLADRYNVALADSFAAFERHVLRKEDLAQYLSHVNHPTKAGHQLAANEIAKYFIAR